MTEHPIPEDLQGRYIELTRWDKGPLNGMQMPWQCSLRDEANLIERIAALEAENAQLNAHCERFSAALMDWENREAAVCPEDVGFEEVFVALEAQVRQLREALEGLLARHCDGSDERHWAEWDTAKEALEGCK